MREARAQRGVLEMSIWLAGGPGIPALTGAPGPSPSAAPHRACLRAADGSSPVSPVPLPDGHRRSPGLLVSALETWFSFEVELISSDLYLIYLSSSHCSRSKPSPSEGSDGVVKMSLQIP